MVDMLSNAIPTSLPQLDAIKKILSRPEGLTISAKAHGSFLTHRNYSLTVSGKVNFSLDKMSADEFKNNISFLISNNIITEKEGCKFKQIASNKLFKLIRESGAIFRKIGTQMAKRWAIVPTEESENLDGRQKTIKINLETVFGDKCFFEMVYKAGFFENYSSKTCEEAIAKISDPVVQKKMRTIWVASRLKLIGHVFSLEGLINIGEARIVNLEGSNIVLINMHICEANINYLQSDHAKQLMPEEDIVSLLEMSTSAVANALAVFETRLEETIDRITQDILDEKVVSLPLRWEGHSFNITIHKDLLILTNKGEGNQEPGHGQIVYKMEELVVGKLKEVLKKLLDSSLRMWGKAAEEKEKYIKYINFGIQLDLNLKRLGFIAKADLKVGNCGHANNKADMQSGPFTLAYQRIAKRMREEGTFSESKCFKEAATHAFHVFKSVEMMDRLARFEEVLALEPPVLSEDVDFKPQEYYHFLTCITGKLAGKNKFQKYISSKKEGLAWAQQTALKLIKNAGERVGESLLPLMDCAISGTRQKALRALQGCSAGAFVFYQKENAAHYYLAYNKSVGKAIICDEKGPYQLNNRVMIYNDEPPLYTLNDLKRSMPELSLPCSIHPIIIPPKCVKEEILRLRDKLNEADNEVDRIESDADIKNVHLIILDKIIDDLEKKIEIISLKLLQEDMDKESFQEIKGEINFVLDDFNNNIRVLKNEIAASKKLSRQDIQDSVLANK